MTYIDRKQVMEYLTKEYNYRHSQGERDGLKLAWIEKAVNSTPTVEAIPVRHGKWIDEEQFKRTWYKHHVFKCSECGNILDFDGVNAGRGDANFCPHCGAKMDAERKEE